MALRNDPRPQPRSGGRATRVAALDVGYAAIRAVEVELGPSGARILKRGCAPLPPGCLDDVSTTRAHLPGAIKAALGEAGITSTSAIASVPRRLVTLKYARLPHATPEQVAGMVQFEAQQYIPFPIEEVVLDHEIVSDPDDDLTSVMIVAARRNVVEEVMAAFDAAGIEITRLSVSSLALAEFGRDSMTPTALLDVDTGEMDMAIVADGRMVFSRAAALSEGVSPSVSSFELADEVIRSLAAYENEHRGHPVGAVKVSGPSDAVTAVQTSLAGVIGAETARLNGSLIPSDGTDSWAYAGALGLALSADGRGLSRISLVPASRAERKLAAKRRLQGIGAVVMVAVLFAAAIYWGSMTLTQQSKDRGLAANANAKMNMAVDALNRTKAAHDRVTRAYLAAAAGLDRSRPAVDVLKAVSDATPKQSVYLTQLSIDRTGTVTVHGMAASESAATDMVLTLQKAKLFTEVRLGYMGDAAAETGTTATNPTAGLVRAKPGEKMSFIITAKMPPIPDGEEASGARRPAGAPGNPAAARPGNS